MENWQTEKLLLAFLLSRGKIFSFGKWVDAEIEDPYKKGQAFFERMFNEVQEYWGMWQKKLWNA